MVTRDDAIRLIESGMRNWPHIPRIDADDLEDLRASLEGIVRHHRQSAIAELCEGLRAARAALEQLDEAASNFSVSGVYFEEPIFTSNCEALEKARAAVDRAEALLSKHSPDAPGDDINPKGDAGQA